MNNFIEILHQLLKLLPRARRIQLILLAGLMLLGALAELISLGAIFPFLSVLSNAEYALQQHGMAWIGALLPSTDGQDIRLILACMFIVAAIGTGAIRLTLLYAVSKFNFGLANDWSVQIFRCALYQPYAIQVTRNTSEIIGGVTKVDAAAGVIYALLIGMSAALMAGFLIVGMIFIDPRVASISFIGFGFLYLCVSLATKKRLSLNSRESGMAYNARIKILQEGLGGIREVLLDHAQKIFVRRFFEIDKTLRKSQASSYFIGPSPRYVVEAGAMVLIAVLALRMSNSPAGLQSNIPLLGALALATQRLMPLLQQIYQGWSTATSNKHVLVNILELMQQPLPADESSDCHPLDFETSVDFHEVSFRYADDSPLVLENFNLAIPKGSRVGFVGVTGSGKSTTMDLLMGLILPTSGAMLVDGVSISDDTQKAWQKRVAHVPQTIFLADASFAENIAFGVSPSEIDLGRVRSAASRAQISDFIESTQGGYDALVGERGARLSGGQRQRLGVARALYKNAQVLVLDEATSALDQETESRLMQSIADLGRDLTIVVITHRTSTLWFCDSICELQGGKIAFTGGFDEFIEHKKSDSGQSEP